MTIAALNEIRMFLYTPVANVRASLMAAQSLARTAPFSLPAEQQADVRAIVDHLERAELEPHRRAHVLEILDRLESGLLRSSPPRDPSLSALPFRGRSDPVELSGRDFGETFRILLDGRRNHGLPSSEILASAVVHGGLPLAKAVRWFGSQSVRSRLEAIRGEVSGVFRRLEGRGTYDEVFLEEVEGRYPPLYFERPQMKVLITRLRQGRLEEIPKELDRIGPDVDLLLAPLFLDLAGFLGRQDSPISVAPFLEFLQARLSSVEAASRDRHPGHFSAEIYRKVNTRDFREYSAVLFGEDALHWVGIDLKPGETVLGRLLQDLPRGAIVADWGGGAGMFGMTLKEWRRDLTVYVNDLHAPEDILWSDRDGGLIHRLRDSGVHFLTGDALTMRLPDGDLADVNIAVLLTPYLPDPLRLLTHLYNQTRPRGLVAMTLTPGMNDVTIARQDTDAAVDGLMHDLWSLGIEARLLRRHRTLLLRRPDYRRLSPVARLVKSQRVTRGRPYPFETFYWPEEGAKERWVALR